MRLGAIVALLLASSCGARTALSEPCTIPLEREPAAVVYLVHWTLACHRGDSRCLENWLLGGRDKFEAISHSLSYTLEVIDGVALTGAMPTQTIRLEDLIPDLPDGGVNPAWCATPEELTVGIGPDNGSSLQAYFDPAAWSGLRHPNGRGLVLPNLPVVERSLLRAGSARTRRLLILLDTGGRGCSGPDYSSLIDDARYAEIRGAFERLADEGIRTLVLGMTRDFEPWQYEVQGRLRTLSAEAEGGGLARDPTPDNPGLFYDYADEAAVRPVLHDELVAPFYCTLYATEAAPGPANVALISSSGDELPHDPSHLDGWDFADADYTTIHVFGPACDSAIESRASFHLLVQGAEC